MSISCPVFGVEIVNSAGLEWYALEKKFFGSLRHIFGKQQFGFDTLLFGGVADDRHQ